MKQLRKSLVLLIALTLIISQSIIPVAFADGNETVIYILHTNDMHGRVLDGRFDGMGMARIATLINDFKSNHDHVLVLDAGDTFHGMPVATLERGASIVRVMNEMGYNTFVPGNHDFNYGQERLLELQEMANFDFVAANIIVEETGEYYLPPYVIYEVAGYKIGIFGLATPETLYKSHPSGTVGLNFLDPVEVSKEMVELLRPQVDVLIALSHLGIDESSKYEETSTGVAKEVRGIDLIVDGHSHTFIENGLLVEDTLIVMAEDYNKHLGVVKIVISDEGMELEASLILKADAMELEPDAEIVAFIEALNTEQSVILDEVIGETSFYLDGKRENVRTGETNLGHLLTDAMVHVTGADFAFTNGGGMRTSIEVGEITRGNVISVLPFGNVVVTKRVSGKAIHEALEVAASGYPAEHGAFAHVSGLTYNIDPNKPAGERVGNIMIGGQAIDHEKYYVMATNDFLAAGGDGMTMFVDAEQVGAFMAMDEAVIAYVAEKGINEVEGGRITFNPVQETVEVIEYVVVRGDVLWRIAQKYGHTYQELAAYNNLKNPNLILIGQKLLIPVK